MRRIEAAFLRGEEDVIAAGGIEEPAGGDERGGAGVFERDAVSAVDRFDGAGGGLEADFGAEGGGVIEEEGVEFRAIDLIGVIEAAHEAGAEIDGFGGGTVGGVEERAVFRNEPGGFDPRPDADVAEDGVGHREERFADAKTGKRFLLDHQGAPAVTSRAGRSATAAGTAADHEGIVIKHGSGKRAEWERPRSLKAAREVKANGKGKASARGCDVG